MTHPDDRTLTSSGFYVSQEAPISCENPTPTPTVPAPDILRCAYMELVVTDLKRAHNFAQAVEAGMVWLNSNNVRDLRTPFGGVKASGLGHEGGYRSIDFYTDQQAVHITLGPAHNPTFGKGR